MFNEFDKYKKPLVKQINKNVTVGIYFPTVKNLDSIVVVKDSKNGKEIALYSSTLINISNIFIKEILSSSDRFFFNRTSKKINKKGFKARKKK